MQPSVTELPGKNSYAGFPPVAFLAFPNQIEFLLSELRERFSISENAVTILGDLVLLNPEAYAVRNAGEITRGCTLEIGTKCDCGFQNSFPYCAKLVLLEPVFVHFISITDAAHALKKMQRSWAPYAFQFFRRTALIREKLPYINLKPKTFPFDIKTSAMGFFSLTGEHTMLVSKKTSSIFPCGEITFEENHVEPPSRAYLKLQEALVTMKTFFGCGFPSAGETVFDAGASPGGWSWVFLKCGCTVFAVDRAPLSDSLMNHTNLHFEAGDAFSKNFETHWHADWLVSDVICYPERLYKWLSPLVEMRAAKKIIATIKMQGDVDWNLAEKFSALPHSRVVHLNYNKHELTFLHFEK